MLTHLGDVEADRIREEDERQAEGGNHAQHGRVELYIEQAQTRGTKNCPQTEEDGDLREIAALDQARNKGGYHYHCADQCQHRYERLGVKSLHKGVLYLKTKARPHAVYVQGLQRDD